VITHYQGAAGSSPARALALPVAGGFLPGGASISRKEAAEGSQAMTDTDNLVLARLRDIRGVLDTVVTKLDEVVTRIGHLERSVAQQAMQFADMNVRLDGMEKRLGRIEVHAGLLEAQNG